MKKSLISLSILILTFFYANTMYRYPIQNKFRCSNSTDEKLQKKIPLRTLKIRYLDLSNSQELTTEGLKHLYQCKNLEYLKIHDCTQIISRLNEWTENLIRNCPKLNCIDVSWALKITYFQKPR